MTKILLVEDDKSLREIYGVRLLAEGYDIVSAGDGEEALAMAIKERPTLIVSDVMMPKISGFDMLDILRSTTETRDIKVIMMTALSSEDQRARGEALGADRYLVKSQVGIEDVVRTVHEVLGDAPVATPSAAETFGAPMPSAAPRTFTPTTTPERPQAPVYTTPQADQQPAAQQFTPQPQQPAPQPQQPVAQPQQPTPSQQPSAPLPQPTAPFSTNRPGGSLIDRIIHPISQNRQAGPDMASLIEQELSEPAVTTTLPPTPTPPPVPAAPAPTFATTPQQPAAPQPMPWEQPAAQPTTETTELHGASAVSFEETPRQPASTPPANNPFGSSQQPPAF